MSKEGCDIDENSCKPISEKLKNWKVMYEHAAWLKCIKKQEVSKDATVVGVVNAVLGSVSDANVRENLEKFKDVLSENVTLKILKGLDGYPFKALFFFEWLEENGGYTHNGVTYNAILKVLKQKESINEFWRVINEMRNAGYNLDIDVYRKVSRHFWNNTTMVDDMVRLYEVVMDGPYKPRDQACDFILRGIADAESPDVSLIDRVVRKHEAAGNSLSKKSYDRIYKCLADSGKFDEAEKILDTMRNAGYEPDKVTYGHMLFALGKAGRLEETTKVLSEMEASGCNPDWATYTCLIQGQIKRGEIDHALTFYTMILEKNLKVDAEFMNHLVKGLCSSEMVGKAHTLVTELVQKADFKPSHLTCITLIENLLKEGKLQKGLDLLPIMKKHAYPWPRQSIGDYVTKFGTMDDAENFLATFQLLSSRTVIAANVDFLGSFIKAGRQSQALDLLRKCPDHVRTNPDIVRLFKFKALEC